VSIGLTPGHGYGRWDEDVSADLRCRVFLHSVGKSNVRDEAKPETACRNISSGFDVGIWPLSLFGSGQQVRAKSSTRVVPFSRTSYRNKTLFPSSGYYRGRIINGGSERLILFLCLGMFWTGGTSYLSTQHGVMRFGIDGDHAASGSYLPSEVGRGRGTGFYL
jgi:hypothetical protein